MFFNLKTKSFMKKFASKLKTQPQAFPNKEESIFGSKNLEILKDSRFLIKVGFAFSLPKY